MPAVVHVSFARGGCHCPYVILRHNTIIYNITVQLYNCIFTMHIHIRMIVIRDLFGLLRVLAAAVVVVVVVVEEDEVVVEVGIMVKHFVVASNLVLCFWLAASLSSRVADGHHIYRASHLQGMHGKYFY